MKAFTVQQPFAWAIAAGYKTVENRTQIARWRPFVGERVALHAGLKWSPRGAKFEPLVDAYLHRNGLTLPLRDDHPFVYGAVIATVDVVGLHFERNGCCAPWGEESYFAGGRRVSVAHMVLANVTPVRSPLPWRGQVFPFEIPDDAIAPVVLP